MAREPASSAADFLPERLTLSGLRAAAEHCRGCELYKRATQTVFGEGPVHARAMFVGEQPGDEEDLAGHPFVGPSGRFLDKCLEEAGVDRGQVYVTNAVKHFKWTPRGKRRLHGKPNSREMAACRPWLEAELELVEPSVLVLLGATAAQSLLGSSFRITRQRGQSLQTDFAGWTMATYHPSAVLRAPDDTARARMHAEFVADLRLVAAQMRRAK